MRILLIAKDTEQYTNWFPHGIAYLAAVLLNRVYDVEIYSQDVLHYPDEYITDQLDKNHFDIVGVGAIGGYYQHRKLFKISYAVNISMQRPFYIIGGHAVSSEPEYFLRKTKADVIARGEAEVTIIQLLEAVAGLNSLSKIKGITFWEGNNVVSNEERDLIKDIDTIPFPAFICFL